MVTMETCLVRAPEAVEQLFPGEAVVMLPQQGAVKVLNDVGARIWALLDGERPLRAIRDLLCAEYAVEPAQAERDLLAFAQELLQRSMVSLKAPAP